MNIQLSHVQYKPGDDIRGNARAVRNRLWPVKARQDPPPVVVKAVIAEIPASRPKHIEPIARPYWQTHLTTFNAHVIAHGDYFRSKPSLEIRKYIRKRCAEVGISFNDLIGPSRNRTLVGYRHQIIFETFNLYGKGAHPEGKSLPELGRAFNRDHTVILHAVNKIKADQSKKIR